MAHTNDRRAFPRIRGPFDGVRVGMLDVGVRIYDLSAGGCFVASMVPAKVGESVQLKIDLADEGWIDVTGAIVPTDRTLGYAVRFVAMDNSARETLKRTVARLARS
jgi:hypothetical protein